MDKFAGLCIGGPLDGKRMVSARDTFDAYDRPDLPPLSEGPTSPPTTLAVERHSYRWLTLWGVGLWVVQGLSSTAVAESLLLCYEQAHKS